MGVFLGFFYFSSQLLFHNNLNNLPRLGYLLFSFFLFGYFILLFYILSLYGGIDTHTQCAATAAGRPAAAAG